MDVTTHDFETWQRQPAVWQVILEAVEANPEITPGELMRVSGLASDIQTELISILCWQINPYPASAATLRQRYKLDAHGLTKLLIAELAKQLQR